MDRYAHLHLLATPGDSSMTPPIRDPLTVQYGRRHDWKAALTRQDGAGVPLDYDGQSKRWLVAAHEKPPSEGSPLAPGSPKITRRVTVIHRQAACLKLLLLPEGLLTSPDLTRVRDGLTQLLCPKVATPLQISRPTKTKSISVTSPKRTRVPSKPRALPGRSAALQPRGRIYSVSGIA